MSFRTKIIFIALIFFCQALIALGSCSYKISGCDTCRSAKACDSCSAGYYLTGVNTCSPCPKNKYSAAGATKCTYCTLTQWAPAGSKSCSSNNKFPSLKFLNFLLGCMTGCDTCNDGETCNSCSAGYYLEVESTLCVKCPTGKTSNPGSYECS